MRGIRQASGEARVLPHTGDIYVPAYHSAAYRPIKVEFTCEKNFVYFPDRKADNQVNKPNKQGGTMPGRHKMGGKKMGGKKMGGGKAKAKKMGGGNAKKPSGGKKMGGGKAKKMGGKK